MREKWSCPYLLNIRNGRFYMTFVDNAGVERHFPTGKQPAGDAWTVATCPEFSSPSDENVWWVHCPRGNSAEDSFFPRKILWEFFASYPTPQTYLDQLNGNK